MTIFFIRFLTVDCCNVVVKTKLSIVNSISNILSLRQSTHTLDRYRIL